jgi:anti-sigma factor RsiW
MPTHCKEIDPLIQTYLDGELAESELFEFENHIANCFDCSAKLKEEEAFHRQLRAELAAPPASDLLKQRVRGLLDEEDRVLARAARRQGVAWVLPGGASIAAAAALALFVFQETRAISPAPSPVVQEVVQQRMGTSLPVMQTGTRPELSRAAQEYTRIPVRPPRFDGSGADLRGFQRAQVQGRDAAVFVYEISTPVGIHTVYVHTLDARDLDLRSPDRRVIDGREIWVAQPRGFSTVSYKDELGVGYVFSSDMEPDDLVALVLRSDLLFLVSERLYGR